MGVTSYILRSFRQIYNDDNDRYLIRYANSYNLSVCVWMGDLEIFYSLLILWLLGIVVYTILNALSFKSVIRRLGITKVTRRDFYECGFRPVQQKPFQLSIQFLLICVFFLVYDIELVFSLPLVASLSTLSGLDILWFFFLLISFGVSLLIDLDKHAIEWYL